MLQDGSQDLAYVDKGQDNSEEAVPTDSQEAEENTKVTDITNVGGDEMFDNIRMKLQDKRSMEKSRLNDVVASSTTSANEKDEALQEIDVLEDLSAKEGILEQTIVGDAGYEDVLVRSDDDKIHVHVKVEELSKTEANNIIQMVRDEFGEVTVDIKFQPTDSK